MDKSPDKSLVYSRKHLQNMLVDRYQEKMYFTSQKRQTDVMCFKRYMSASNFTSQKRQTDVMYFKRYMSARVLLENIMATLKMMTRQKVQHSCEVDKKRYLTSGNR